MHKSGGENSCNVLLMHVNLEREQEGLLESGIKEDSNCCE